mmetsp:Transcript_89224/g.139628  ORF Transcript_89224/g.139628 Transcript_89224/m.139628 type:complete len:825 (-) Transcript_89224:234-2708(-)
MGCTKSVAVEKTNLKEDSTSTSSKKPDKKALAAQNNAFAETLNFLGNVPLFKTLPKDQTPLLASACENIEFKPGQTVIKEGDSGEEFFCIRSGEATVMLGSKKVATLKSGDYFGESALLRDEPRSATVVALTALQAFKITRDKFQALGLNDQLHFVNRKAVGYEGQNHGRQIEVRPPSPKTDTEKADMYQALESNANLKVMNLDRNMMNQMIEVAWRQDVAAGTALITQGEINADYFYLVHSGTFEILVKKDKDKGEGKAVGSLSKGGSFGELALFYCVPRAATVKCKKNGAVWVIDRQNFKQIMMKKSQDKIAECVKLLDRVDILTPLSSEEKAKLSRALVEVHFKKGESIIKQGEDGSAFYILYDGEVSVIKDGKEVTKLDAVPAKMTAQFLGEGALLNDEKRAATVQVVSSSAKVFALDREDFNCLLGPLKELMTKQNLNRQKTLQKHASTDTEKEASSSKKEKKGGAKLKGSKSKSKTLTNLDAAKSSSEKQSVPSREKILFSELKVLGLLGCGGFGAVELVEHQKSSQSFALKAVSKGYIVQTGMKESISNEKNILTMTNSPFIIKLFECYNSDQNIYFLLEPALGGELYATYNRRGFHGKEAHAKYYTAGVVYAFEHCHVRHIIYRDLKPENLLLTAEGKVKLTDMGLAKFVVGTTFTTCGTPDYFAPELISSEGHTVAVDWWTLGILIYELMGGNPPFESDNPMQTYQKVVKGIDQVNFHKKCLGVVENLIKSLLRQKPAERIPMRPGGIKNVMDHEWYKDFDWKAMQQGSLEPPYKPTVKSKTDMKNFHARAEDKPPQIPYKDDGTGWDKDFATSV